MFVRVNYILSLLFKNVLVLVHFFQNVTTVNKCGALIKYCVRDYVFRLCQNKESEWITINPSIIRYMCFRKSVVIILSFEKKLLPISLSS